MLDLSQKEGSATYLCANTILPALMEIQACPVDEDYKFNRGKEYAYRMYLRWKKEHPSSNWSIERYINNSKDLESLINEINKVIENGKNYNNEKKGN